MLPMNDAGSTSDELSRQRFERARQRQLNAVTSQTFRRDCQHQLLLRQVVADGVLSQTDYGTFVNNYCVTSGSCNPANPPLQFVNLDINLQLAFVWSICPQGNSTGQLSCLQNLQSSGQEFGFVITPDTFPQVVKAVSSLCQKLYPLLQQAGLIPTAAPSPDTIAPTIKLSTNAPTVQPSTNAPTIRLPTNAPTVVLSTNAPTQNTNSPSSASIGATLAPSAETRTGAPVVATSAPSTAPLATTIAPTGVTTAPSASTPAPSSQTSNTPTIMSTTLPPSPAPLTPTSAPTATPQKATTQPTLLATGGPTVVAPTTAQPSPLATGRPTVVAATTTPSSARPSPLATGGPTVVAATTPSSSPIPFPSGPPSQSPTVHPSLRSATGAPSSRGGVNGIGANGGGSNISASTGSSKGLSSGGIVGVAAAGLALLLVLFLFTRRRRKSLHQSDKILPDYPVVPIEGDESIYTEGTPAYASKKGSGSDVIDDVMLDAMVDTGSIKDGSSDAQSSTSSDQQRAARDLGTFAAASKNVAQYDSVSAAGIALLLKDGNDLSSCASKSTKSSGQPRGGESAGPTQEFLEELEAAVDEADWQLVWRLATSVSQKDDLSTISGATGSVQGVPAIGKHSRADSFSSSSVRKPRPYLDPADEARAAQLDELVERRDWTAVAVTAALFLRQNDPSANFAPLHPRRSFIDFVTGRRVSTAAAAAAAGDSEASLSQNSVTGRVGAEPIAGPVPLIVAAKTDTASTGSDYAKQPSKDSAAASPSRSGDRAITVTKGSNPRVSTASNASDVPSSPARRRASEGVGASAAVVGAVGRQLSKSKKSRIFGFFRRNPSGHVPLESSSSDDSSPNTPKVFKDDSSPSPSGHDETPTFSKQRSGSFSSSLGGSSLASIRTELDRAVLRGDWAAVEALSAQIEAMDEFVTRRGNISKANSSDDDNVQGTPTSQRKRAAFSGVRVSASSDENSASAETSGNSSAASIRTKLDRAVETGDWQAVDYYASVLMELNATGHGGVYEGHIELEYVAPDSTTASPQVATLKPRYVTPTASVSSGSVGVSTDYSGQHSQRVEILDKLVKAEKWKGLRVIAGLYEMDGPSPSRYSFPFTSTYTPQPLSYPNTDADALAEVWRTINAETVTPSTVVGDSPMAELDSLSSGSVYGRHAGSTPGPPKAALDAPLDSADTFDWKGLAGATRGDGAGTSEVDVSRKLFESEVGQPLGGNKGGQVTSILSGEFSETEGERVRLQPGTTTALTKSSEVGSQGLNVELRRVENTASSDTEATGRKSRESLHGAKVLIPFWEELTAQSPQSEEAQPEGDLIEPPQIQRETNQM